MESGPGLVVGGQQVVLREAAVDKLTGEISRLTHILQEGEALRPGDIPYTSVSGSVAAMIQAGFLPADYSPLGGYNGVPLPTPLAISAPSPLYTPGGAFTPSEPTTQTINLVVDGRVLASVVNEQNTWGTGLIGQAVG